MPSKFDRLRAGEIVEIEPGRKGRLNNETKSFETSDGRTMYVGDDPDFYPKDENALAYSREKESLNREIKRAPAGEFLYQFGNQGVAGAAKDWYNRLTKKGDEYIRSKQVNADVSAQISKESPWTSGAATVASFIPDIALTRGMSAMKAAPALTALHSGSRILDEPTQVAGEALGSAAGGFLIDKGASALSRISQRRAQNRALPGLQENVRNSNIQGQEQFNMLKQNVKNSNEARLKQHQVDLESRQNNMIKARNDFEQAKAAREMEVVKLKNQAEMAKAQRSAEASRLEGEYQAAKASAEQETKRLQDEFKLAQAQYQESLKQMPELQRKAQAEFSQQVVKNAQEIERRFPKSSKISTDELGVSEFIENNINKSGLAGSTPGNQARRFLSSLFPEGELIGGRELSKSYRALEDAIQRGSPELQGILSQFKQSLGQRLPVVLEDSIAYHKIYPLLKRTIETDIKSVLNEIPFQGKGMDAFKTNLTKFAGVGGQNAIKQGITPSNFIQKLRNGELSREIANNVLTVEDFLVDIPKESLKGLQKEGILPLLMKDAEAKHRYFVDNLTKRLDNKLARYEIKAVQNATESSKKLGKDIKSTYGLAEPVNPPQLPTAPNPVPLPNRPGELPPVSPVNLPPPVSPPNVPPIPGKPALMPEPAPFTPQAEPVLPQASGMSERIGDLMEKPLLSGGSGVMNSPVTKLAGLKYLLGKAAIPAEAAYLGMNALTSPTAMGEIARMTFKQGGIQAIVNWAERYPSYHNGILESPQDRRSLTKEIEDASDIPIEQKAILQSKVNRGRPLQDRL